MRSRLTPEMPSYDKVRAFQVLAVVYRLDIRRAVMLHIILYRRGEEAKGNLR